MFHHLPALLSVVSFRGEWIAFVPFKGTQDACPRCMWPFVTTVVETIHLIFEEIHTSTFFSYSVQFISSCTLYPCFRWHWMIEHMRYSLCTVRTFPNRTVEYRYCMYWLAKNSQLGILWRIIQFLVLGDRRSICRPVTISISSNMNDLGFSGKVMRIQDEGLKVHPLFGTVVWKRSHACLDCLVAFWTSR